MRLALKVIKETPIDPATEQRVKKAQSAYDKAFDAVRKEALVSIDKKITPAELAVLKKFHCTNDTTGIYIINEDTRSPFMVSLWNERRFKRDNPLPHRYSSDEYHTYSKLHSDSSNAASVTIPIKHFGCYSGEHRSAATAKLIKLYSTLNAAENELEMAEGADDDRRRNITSDFRALIHGSRTFEDVVEVWEEAKEVTHLICGPSTAVSLVSDDAIDRIKANVALRAK